jgi:hypothetical protein
MILNKMPLGCWFFLLAAATCLSTANAFGLLERFRVTCPADPSSVRRLEPSLIDNNDNAGGDGGATIWVAVYRSNQNKPSVLNNRNEFLNSMKIATTATTEQDEQQQQQSASSKNTDTQSWSNLLETPMALEKPVAVAQLRPSPDFEDKYVLDSLRCGLRKEEQDASCDGGSEYLEALSVAVDTLLVHHLTSKKKQIDDLLFEGAIRTKGTLFSGNVLETRGFAPVEELSKDMATHVSNYEECLNSYTERANDEELSPAGRDRALQIVSLLGRLDREKQSEAAAAASSGDGDDDEYDPWANINLRR